MLQRRLTHALPYASDSRRCAPPELGLLGTALLLAVCSQLAPEHAFSQVPPPEPDVAPFVSASYPNDSNEDRLDDLLANRLSEIQADQPQSSAPWQPSDPSVEPIDVEMVFSRQITQQQIDRFLALGGAITYIYRSVSYGWNGTVPSDVIDRLPAEMGDSLVLVQAPQQVAPQLQTATQTGRVRPIWDAGFAGGSGGFQGDSTITFAVIDSGVDGTHPDLAGRSVYWKDFSSDNELSPVDSSGHGTHATGIAIGSGAASGSVSGDLHYTETLDFRFFLPGGFRRSPMEIPPGAVTLSSEAHWLGGDPAELSGLERSTGSTGADSNLSDPTTGTTPLTEINAFTASAGEQYQPALSTTGSNTSYQVLNTISNYGAVGDGFNRFRGVAPGANWAGAKVFSHELISNTALISAAIDDLVSQRVALNLKLINLSLGIVGEPGINVAFRQKINTAAANGILPVISAGNSGTEGTAGGREIDDPGRAAYALTVGASNDINELTEYTSHGFGSPDTSTAGEEEGHKPDLLAPGGSDYYSFILGPDSNTCDALDVSYPDGQADDYVNMRGTSMAAPFAGGAAILVIQALQQGGLTWDHTSTQHPMLVKMLLCATSTETNAPREVGSGFDPSLERDSAGPSGFPVGKDGYEGFGMINPDAAVEAVALEYAVGDMSMESLGGGVTERRAWARTINLLAGKELNLDLTNPPGGDFDLYLYDCAPTSFGSPLVIATSTSAGTGVDDSIVHTSPVTKDCLLVVKCVSGSGSFTLDSSYTPVPEVSLHDGATTVTDGTGPIDFGVTERGSAALSKTFTVENIGDAALNTSNLTVPTGYSISEGLAASIASLSSDTFTIDLPTTTAGTFAGTISFDNNDADENPYNFTVTGTITSPEVDLFEDATPIADGGGPIDFGSVLQGSAAPSKTFRVENNGDATLNTSNLTVPAGYSVTEPLATTLLPATSDTFTVALSTATSGTFAGPVSFENNDPNEDPYNFSITGTVVTPEIEVSPAAHDFGSRDVDDGPTSPAFEVTIQNTGTAPLTFTGGGISLIGADAPDFDFATTPSTLALAPGTSRTVELVFDPSVVGARAAQLQITTDDLDEPAVTVDLTGTGIDQEIDAAPLAIDLGGQPVEDGPTSSQTILVANLGSNTLTFTGNQVELIGPDAAEFAIDSDSGQGSLAPGTTRTLQVSFDPASAGAKTATLRITSDDTDEPVVDVALAGHGQAPEADVREGATPVADGGGPIDFGAAPRGDGSPTKTFTVDNIGDAPLATANLSVPAGYSVTEPLAGSIAPSTSDTFTVELSTAAPGTFAGTINFETNDADEDPYDFTVTGTITSPEVDLFEDATPIADGGGPIDFGSALQGGAAPSKTFRVENNGDATLNTSNLTVPAGYSVTEPLAASIAPAGNDTFTVALSTATSGTFAGSVSFDNDDTDEDPYNFSVNGMVTTPEINVLQGPTPIANGAGPVDFGSQLVGSAPTSLTFTVENLGTATLDTSGLSVPPGYTILAPLAPSIVSGTSESFVVQLDTDTTGIFDGTISFNDSDLDENPFSFTVTGRVTSPQLAVFEDASPVANGGGPIDFGTIDQFSATPTRTFTVQNDGDADLQISTISVPAGFEITEALVTTITPGTSDTFTIAMPTAEFGINSGSVEFDTNDPDATHFSFELSGVVTEIFSPDLIWVDFDYIGLEVGTSLAPFRTLDGALGVVSDEGTLRILSGTTSETPRITNPVRLEAFNGPVRIGDAGSGEPQQIHDAPSPHRGPHGRAGVSNWLLYE